MTEFKIRTMLELAALFFIVILVGAFAYTMVIEPNITAAPKLNTGGVISTTPSTNNGVPSSNGVFSGPLTVNLQFLNHGNLDGVYTAANGTGKIYHADGTLFGVMTTAGVISGNVLPADNGQLYLEWQPASTVYLDAATTASANSYLSTATPKAVQGVLYYYFPLNVASLTQISGITTTLNLNMYLEVADVSGLTLVSQGNATASTYSGTSWISASANGYVNGLTQTDAFKIVKVELSMPDAANITQFDNNQIKNLQVTLGLGNGQPDWTLTTYTHSTGSSYITFNTGIPDTTQQYYGQTVLYSLTNSPTDLSFKVSCQCANFAASAAWVPTLTITYIGPDGSMGTFSHAVSFTDT